MKQIKTKEDYAKLFKGLLDLAGVSEKEFQAYLLGLMKYPKPGDFQLKNKTFQSFPQWGAEWGIYFTPNLYINIDAMNNWKKNLTAEEVKLWAKMFNYQIPTQSELEAVVPVVSEVNSSLCKVGMRQHILPQDLVQKCWSVEALQTARKDETRRLIVVEYQENLPEILPFLAKLKPQFE